MCCCSIFQFILLRRISSCSPCYMQTTYASSRRNQADRVLVHWRCGIYSLLTMAIYMSQNWHTIDRFKRIHISFFSQDYILGATDCNARFLSYTSIQSYSLSNSSFLYHLRNHKNLAKSENTCSGYFRSSLALPHPIKMIRILAWMIIQARICNLQY